MKSDDCVAKNTARRLFQFSKKVTFKTIRDGRHSETLSKCPGLKQEKEVPAHGDQSDASPADRGNFRTQPKIYGGDWQTEGKGPRL